MENEQRTFPRVLHVDDDEDIRELVKLSFEVVGEIDLIQFGSGLETLENADRISADIFLLDVMMPEISGPETLERLRSFPEFASTPAIFLTARADEKDSEVLRAPGVAAIIRKPFDPMTLAEEVVQIWRSFLPSGN